MFRSVEKAQKGKSATSSNDAVMSPHGDVSGPVRGNVSTKDLAKVLRSGEIALIDHLDLDRVAAETLVDAGIVGVINASASSSGRYPNEGPLILLDAGIALIDEVGSDVMDQLADGERVTISGSSVLRERATKGDGGTDTEESRAAKADGVSSDPADRQMIPGNRQSLESIGVIHEASRATLGAEFIRFVENTAGYFEHNQDLVSDDLEVPDVGIDFSDRHVLMVVRGHDYKQDLALLVSSGYIVDRRPILIGVDGGADAILDAGLTPDVIVGDFDSVSERSLRSGAALVVHAFPNGRAPGAERLGELGLDYSLFQASGTSEDIAMLMAYEQGASLIVAVGTHSSMVDFLDKGRSGMASTILTRMKVGPVLVDAKGVSRLYKQSLRKRDVLLLIGGALLSLLIIALVSDPVRLIVRSLWGDVIG